jgi:hypothetical protein
VFLILKSRADRFAKIPGFVCITSVPLQGMKSLFTSLLGSCPRLCAHHAFVKHAETSFSLFTDGTSPHGAEKVSTIPAVSHRLQAQRWGSTNSIDCRSAACARKRKKEFRVACRGTQSRSSRFEIDERLINTRPPTQLNGAQSCEPSNTPIYPPDQDLSACPLSMPLHRCEALETGPPMPP